MIYLLGLSHIDWHQKVGSFEHYPALKWTYINVGQRNAFRFLALFEQNIFNTLYIIIVLTQITSWSVASGGCSPSHWIHQVVGTGGWFYLCSHTHTVQWPSSQWYPNSSWLYNTAASVLCRLDWFIVVISSPQPVSKPNFPKMELLHLWTSQIDYLLLQICWPSHVWAGTVPPWYLGTVLPANHSGIWQLLRPTQMSLIHTDMHFYN